MNLFPKSCVFMKVPYFAMPISKGENSTHSWNDKGKRIRKTSIIAVSPDRPSS